MKKLGVILSTLILLGAAVFLGIAGKALDRTRQALARLNADMDTVAAELEKTGETFTNEAALECFAREREDPLNDADAAMYRSPEGIRFRSQSESWDEEKLEALYQELLLNQHGEELYTLAEVIVHPEPEDYILASHQDSAKGYRLTLNYPALPKQSIFTFYRSSGVINLYDGDARDTIGEMAESLSHEYGHHFTNYYMLDTPDGCPYYTGTEYARLRKLENIEQVRTFFRSSTDYYENHAWYFYEIAAEDYVVLMGSPNSRTVVDYCDVQEALDGRDGDRLWARNADVQENLAIPMANTVPGLAEYFYSCIGLEAPEYDVREITISFEKKENEVWFDGEYHNFISYEATWNKAYGEDAVYTLVAYDPENYSEYRHAVKTVSDGEDASAIIGTVAKVYGDFVHYYWDRVCEGAKAFVVTVILPDGTMYCSEPQEFTF